MALNYNRHRQKDDYPKQLGSKRTCNPKDDPDNFSVKYVNNRCSPNHIQTSPSTCDQKTIIITVKKKKTQPKKQKMLKEKMLKKNETLRRVNKSKENSLITIRDYLKVLAKKCSTPDSHQPCVYRNQNKRRCSDTCLNMSTPFKTKTVVNTVSMDPKKIPPDCKNLLKHPLMQAQLGIYRCQLKTEKNGGCKTCNSAAIFEVVKCLYDCYKKKKCDPCKCVVCGYLPRNIRKLMHEVGRSSVSVGVETASTNRKTRYTMTPEEDEILSMLQKQAEPPKQPKITPLEKLRMAKALGILTPPESLRGVKMDRAHREENNTEFMTEKEAPCPIENISPLEKMLYLTDQPDTDPSIRVPSKKLRKARASGLLTPLEGKTQQQREKMLRHLAMNNIPLPEGKTDSEKEVITKVRRELGLPPGPRTPEEKERYARAQAAGLITPLKGKSQPQKENILRSLLESGIPLPEGRTLPEKALIDKITLESFLKPMTKSDTEKTIKERARSYVHTLFNKFAIEAGYMVLVETSCVKDTFCNLQAKCLLNPVEVRSRKEETNLLRLTRLKETKSLEKALFKNVEIGVRLIPESQGKTQIRKVIREAEKETVKLTDCQKKSTKKFIKRRPDSRAPLEERITKSNVKLLPSNAVSGNQLLNSKTSLENIFDQRVKHKTRSSNVILERTRRAKLTESESERAKVLKGLAAARLPLTNDYIPLPKENIITVRVKPTMLDKKTCQTSTTEIAISEKVSKGTVTKLISKLVSHVKEDLDNTPAGAAKCDKRISCDTRKLSSRRSYLTIKVSVSDVSNITDTRETRSVFTDTKDIRQTSDIATSLPSIAISNSTVADDAETTDNIPTKENQTSSDTCNSANEDSKSRFRFSSDSDDAASQSHDNERDLDENADLIYIYKPTFEYNARGMLTASSRIILTDSYNISPTTSASLYLIETGSTDSYDSETTVFSYATKDASDDELGTDVFYTSSEPRIFWFYRNSIHKAPVQAVRDAKIYLVSEVKMHQQCEEEHRTKKQMHIHKECNLRNPKDEGVERTAPGQALRRSSSVFIVMSPSRNLLSSVDLGPLIYVEKSDSESKLKTIKLVPHENTQKIDLSKMLRRHTRNEEKTKHSVEPWTDKCSSTRAVASHKLPVTNAFTRYPCNRNTSNRGITLEYSSEQFQKPRIPPKYSDNPKVTTGHATWNEELNSKQPSCSSTCRLGVNPEQRIGRSGKQRIPPKYIEIGPKTTEPARGNKDPLYKAITRYLCSSKNTSFQEKPAKCSPGQRLDSRNPKVCLISSAHSSIYCQTSKVSFSQDPKNIKRGKYSASGKEKCLDPNYPKKRPSQGPNASKYFSDNSLRFCSDDRAERPQEKPSQISIKIAPSSKLNHKTAGSTQESKVRFERPLPPCCPCEKTGSQQSDPDRTKDKLRPSAHEKKVMKKSEPDGSKKESPCCPCEKTGSQQSDPDHTKDKLRSSAHEKEVPKKSEPDFSKKELKPCYSQKISQQSEKESKQCENEKNTEQKSPTDESKTESKLCENEKKTSKQCDTDVSINKPKPCENQKKKSEQSVSNLSKNESNPCEKKKMTQQCGIDHSKKELMKNMNTLDQQRDLEPTCKKVAKETPEVETKTNPCDLDSQSQTSECSSQCPEIVKRATSPKNVNVKSVGVDGSSTSKPSCLVEKPRPVCSEKDKIPEKPQNICDRGKSASLRTSENMCDRKKPTMDSVDKPPADGNVELDQQMKSKISDPSSIRDSNMRPTNECFKQQMVSEHIPNSTQDSVAQPAGDIAKEGQQTESECPADSTQDSVAQPSKDNAKLGQQVPLECPANSVINSIKQPANEKDAFNEIILCRNPVENNNNTKQPAPACPDPPAKSSLETCIQEPSTQKPCSKRKTTKEKRHCRTWWPMKKQLLLRRCAHPAPCRLVEENSMETQCERDVRDLAQMTDGMMGVRGDLEQCNCGDTVNTCQCLLEQAQTMTMGGTKSNSECECPPPILIIKGHQHKYCEKDENFLREHQSHCSCIAILHGEPAIVNPNVTEIKDLGQKSEHQTDAIYIYSLNDFCHCYQQKPKLVGANEPLEPGGKKNVICECPTIKPTEKMVGGQYGTDGACQSMTPGPGSKKNITSECARPTTCKSGTCQGTPSEPGGKKNVICECPKVKATEKTAGGQYGNDGACQSMAPGPGSNKNITSECPRPTTTGQAKTKQTCKSETCQDSPSEPGGKKNVISECARPTTCKSRTCQGASSESGGKKKVICECPTLKATEQTAGEQYGKGGACQSVTPGPGSKKNITSDCARPSTAGQAKAHQTCKTGTCQGGGTKNVKCECPRPPTIVKEQTTAVQCKKGEQRSCDNLAKVDSCESKQHSSIKWGCYKKTVICESPSKDKVPRPAPGNAPCQKTAGSKKINLCLGKKSRGEAGECSNSDDGTECQDERTRVKWCQKKYVISECPPQDSDADSDPVCMSPERKKQLKKNAKNQAKIKTKEKKVGTSCTHGSTPCKCKDSPICWFKKNHICECPCPLSVEEVDLNSGKYCLPEPPCPEDCPPTPPPCPAKDVNEKEIQKKCLDRGQMAIDKIDKSSYTDRPIKNICKAKNKSSGQGKWGKKKLQCICPPEPEMTETGCDPPCVKEQWRMRSRRSCSKSGFSVMKKPAPRVDLTMCFEEALAYFEQHPEDDPMQKKKKKVLCECPPADCF